MEALLPSLLLIASTSLVMASLATGLSVGSRKKD